MENRYMTEDTDKIMEQIRCLRIFQTNHATVLQPEIETDLCIWCENETAIVLETHLWDKTLPDCDNADYILYHCTTCGARYKTGQKITNFTDYMQKGRPELYVHCECLNCRWNFENPSIGDNEYGCANCETEPNGQIPHSDPTAHTNWTPMHEHLPECPKCGESGVRDKAMLDGRIRYACSKCEEIWTLPANWRTS